MKATVELIHALSHTGRNGRTMVRGRPQIITNPADIEYYQNQREYVVTVTSEAASKKAAKSFPPPKARARAPEPEPEEDDAEDLDESDDEDDAEDLDDETDVGDGVAVPAKAVGPTVYRKGDLEKMTKQVLFELATHDFKLDVDTSTPKPALVAKLLKAQTKKLQG
jgi:hypothetical protein